MQKERKHFSTSRFFFLFVNSAIDRSTDELSIIPWKKFINASMQLSCCTWMTMLSSAILLDDHPSIIYLLVEAIFNSRRSYYPPNFIYGLYVGWLISSFHLRINFITRVYFNLSEYAVYSIIDHKYYVRLISLWYCFFLSFILKPKIRRYIDSPLTKNARLFQVVCHVIGIWVSASDSNLRSEDY